MSPKAYSEEVRVWLATALVGSGKSQAEIARQLSLRLGRDFDRSQVNKMRLGRRTIKADELAALSAILGVPEPRLDGHSSQRADMDELARLRNELETVREDRDRWREQAVLLARALAGKGSDQP